MRNTETVIFKLYLLCAAGGFAAGCILAARQPQAAGTLSVSPLLPLPTLSGCTFGEAAGRLMAAFYPLVRVPLLLFFAGFTIFALPAGGIATLSCAVILGRWCALSGASGLSYFFAAAGGAAVLWFYLRFAAAAAMFWNDAASVPPGRVLARRETRLYTARFLALCLSLLAMQTAIALIAT